VTSRCHYVNLTSQVVRFPPSEVSQKTINSESGSLLTYFETKADLFNELYLELKREMASAAMKNLPEGGELREQFSHIWRDWMNSAVAYPEKRRALVQLGVSDEITPATRAAAIRRWQESPS
jgi:AcrR family transcriptional regulator